jgi:lysophospholipase L1-like esterase
MPFNLTAVNPTYNASSKFGQSLNGGHAYSSIPPLTGYPYTLRATVKAAASSAVEVAAGQAGFGWIGKSASNTVLAHYGFGTDVELAANVNLADGQYHEVELCVSATGGSLFVDGVLVASSTTATSPVTNRYFSARAFFNTANSAAATFPWTGEIDQVALFNTVQHTSAYTPSTTAMTGSESDLAALYSFSNNTNDTAGSVSATPIEIAYNNANIFYSPSNWDDRGTYMSSANPGAYARVAFSGTSVGVKVDVAAMVSASLPVASYPIVRTVIDGVSFVDTQLTSSSTAISRSGLSTGAHTLDVFFLAADVNNGDRWVTPVNAVRITGFTLDSGAAVSAVAKRSKTALFFGDSIWEGYLAAGTVTTQPTGNNCLLTTVPGLAKVFDAEYGTIAFSGQGYQVAGNNGAVAFPSAYASHSSGRSRLVAGLFSPAPDYIFVQHGTNGTTTQADVQAMIANLRAAAPNARILMLVPANGKARAQITAAVAAVANAAVNLIDIGTGYSAGIVAFGGGANLYSLDGLHPNPLSNALVGAANARAVQSALATAAPPALTARTVSIVLASGSAQLAANLTGLRVAFHDEPSPASFTVPRFQSSAGTTDSAGVLTFVVNSTLAAGGTGHLTVLGASNIHFNGPVQVT